MKKKIFLLSMFLVLAFLYYSEFIFHNTSNDIKSIKTQNTNDIKLNNKENENKIALDGVQIPLFNEEISVKKAIPEISEDSYTNKDMSNNFEEKNILENKKKLKSKKVIETKELLSKLKDPIAKKYFEEKNNGIASHYGVIICDLPSLTLKQREIYMQILQEKNEAKKQQALFRKQISVGLDDIAKFEMRLIDNYYLEIEYGEKFLSILENKQLLEYEKLKEEKISLGKKIGTITEERSSQDAYIYFDKSD